MVTRQSFMMELFNVNYHAAYDVTFASLFNLTYKCMFLVCKYLVHLLAVITFFMSTYDDFVVKHCNRLFIIYVFSKYFVIQCITNNFVFLFIHSIEGAFVPLPGDEVMYRLCPIPPKLEKYQAVHVRINHLTAEKHLKWDEPPV